MKFCLGILLFLVGVYSCTSSKKEDVKLIENYCQVVNKKSDCLDITVNPDTVALLEKIKVSKGNVLLIFTGRAISGKALLDKEFLENNQIFDELKKYTIYLLYVDERNKVNDSIVYDERNMRYHQAVYNSAVFPHYIIYSNGVKQCEENYLNEKERINQFLHCVK